MLRRGAKSRAETASRGKVGAGSGSPCLLSFLTTQLSLRGEEDIVTAHHVFRHPACCREDQGGVRGPGQGGREVSLGRQRRGHES